MRRASILAAVLLGGMTSSCGMAADIQAASACQGAVDAAYDPEVVKKRGSDLPDEALDVLLEPSADLEEFKASDWGVCMTDKGFRCNMQIDGKSVTIGEAEAWVNSPQFDLDKVGPPTGCASDSGSVNNPYVKTTAP